MIHVTHDQLEAMTLGDRIVLLHNGRIEQVGTPADLYHRPVTRYAAAFMGSPTMNLLPVTVADGTATLASGDHVPLPGVPDSGRASLGVRPEHLKVTGAGPDVLSVSVVLVEDIGETRIVHAALRDGALVAFRCGTHPAPHEGDVVHLTFDRRHAHVFDGEGRRVALPGE
jgi:ABC-type sugar transport system ATPase subunit